MLGEAMVIFNGPDAYVTPSWYQSKREHAKVVPTWNYVDVHAYGEAEFFEDEARLHDAVSRLTRLYEIPRVDPWAVSGAPEPFIKRQLKCIVGVKLTISRIKGKVKMSQNRSEADRQGVAEGLATSASSGDQVDPLTLGEAVANLAAFGMWNFDGIRPKWDRYLNDRAGRQETRGLGVGCCLSASKCPMLRSGHCCLCL